MEKESNWGGKRAGAGRPKSSTKIFKAIRIEKYLLDELEMIKGTFASKVHKGLELFIEYEKNKSKK